MGRGFDLASLRRLSKLWQEPIEPLTLEGLAAPAGDDQVDAARRTHKANNLRVAQNLRLFLLMPHKVMTNPCMYQLYQKYIQTYQMHEEFPDISNIRAATDYWVSLARSFDTNRNIPLLLGHGRQQLCRLDAGLEPYMDEFLENFTRHRVESHLI